MADLPRPGKVTCPLCDKVCTIPDGSVDSLPSNAYALHIIELNNTISKLINTLIEHDKTISSLNNILKNEQ